MNKRILVAAVLGAIVFYASSCYNNKEDILALPKVSFRKEVVPIMTSGGCGCHNNGTTRAIQFSHLDTVWYDAILSRTSLFTAWTNGGTHPGGGEIDFKPSDKLIVERWLKEGAQDDAAGCTVTGAITYTVNIAPIYTTTCKGSTCHGGVSAVLDYNKLVADKSMLDEMVASGGSKGHPGGALSLSGCTINIFKAWLSQGQPK